MRDGNPLVQRAAFGQLLESLTSENALGIRSSLLESGVDVRGQEWRDFHYAWGAIDGEAAMQSALASKEPDIAHTMAGFASASPDEARRFLETIAEDVKADREQMRRALVSGMADRDPALATSYVIELASQGNESARNLIEVVARGVLRYDELGEAVHWSESLPEGPLKGVAMYRVASSYVHQDPEAAAAWAGQASGQEYAGEMIEEVGDEWSELNPIEAIAWLESLPESSGQYSGLNSAFGNWGHRDPVAAGERLASMPRSEHRDYAISGYSGSLSHRDPLAAIEWANSIAQDSIRNNALIRAGQALFQRDAEAARTWVASSGLPPEAQQQVLSPPSGR